MIRRWISVMVVAAGILLPAATAHAHAQFLRSDPKPDSRQKAVPEALTINFSEPPVSARQVVVEDGCGKDVIANADVEEKQVVVELASGQPGKWNVDYRVVSAVDGHPTEDRFSFRVAGKPDCEQGDAAPPPRDDGDGGSSLPIVLGLGAATVLLVGVALVLRKRS